MPAISQVILEKRRGNRRPARDGRSTRCQSRDQTINFFGPSLPAKIWADAEAVKQKYTIVIDPELHDWFAHRAIDAKSNISALVSDAMEAYRRAHSQNKQASPLTPPGVDHARSDKAIPEAVKKPYVKKIYHPNTTTLNDTPRARKVSQAARKTIGILLKAGKAGAAPQELHNKLDAAKFDFQTRRDTLTYLQDNGIAARRREEWVHSSFIEAPSDGPRSPGSDRVSQG